MSTIKVTCFSNAFATESAGDSPLQEILDSIKTGKWRESITSLRHTLKVDGEAAYTIQKKLLMAFCLSGEAFDRKNMKKHNGLLQVDIDGLNGDYESIREKIIEDPHTAFCFRSPGGSGLKVGVRILAEEDKHKDSFFAVEKYYKNEFDVNIDQTCKDRLRLCFISHDPDLYQNDHASVLEGKVRLDSGEAGDTDTSSNSTTTSSISKTSLPALTRAKINFPAADGQRHQQALEISYNMSATGFPEEDIYNTIRPMYDSQSFKDSEITDLIRGAVSKQPKADEKNTGDQWKQFFIYFRRAFVVNSVDISFSSSP